MDHAHHRARTWKEKVANSGSLARKWESGTQPVSKQKVSSYLLRAHSTRVSLELHVPQIVCKEIALTWNVPKTARRGLGMSGVSAANCVVAAVRIAPGTLYRRVRKAAQNAVSCRKAPAAILKVAMLTASCLNGIHGAHAQGAAGGGEAPRRAGKPASKLFQLQQKGPEHAPNQPRGSVIRLKDATRMSARKTSTVQLTWI